MQDMAKREMNLFLALRTQLFVRSGSKVPVQPVSPLKTGESTQTNKNKCSVSNCAVWKKWVLEIRSSGENPGEPGATTAWSVRSGWWFKEQARTRSICFATPSLVIFPFPWTWPRWSNPELLRIESKRQKSKYPRIWFIGLSRIRNYVKNLRSIQSSILNYSPVSMCVHM